MSEQEAEYPVETPVTLDATILKADDEQRMVYGWASVYSRNGQTVIDRQGDQIHAPEVQTMAHRFVREVRVGKQLHQGHPVGEVVESVVLSKSLQSALGVDLGQEGWLIGMKVHDDAVWNRVKSGALPALSIGGSGRRKSLK
ncbi:XkdF-like putative serine protease domain-containing protein [Candidatus Contendibacter odensensis]|uniref:Phage-like element PBSX protein XkdF domain-containing protein n=1 Tax=Candidatus Contendobacter odensis Run_B_J11 TaxID=1400861 RepID=A0A7U7J301_9GAMM|nr:XkdF-like putative serine protease domain-containing protein [Candidatus Contendobacter odensis]CDH43837.1 conserved hypothetical protein [Candidatus Contendobacter odensis Run_B_J11]